MRCKVLLVTATMGAMTWGACTPETPSFNLGDSDLTPIGRAVITTLVEITTPLHIVVDDQNVYFTKFMGGGQAGVYEISKSTRELEVIDEPSITVAMIAGLALGNGILYWSYYYEGKLMSANVDGGTASVFATGLEEPSSLVVDGDHIYWHEPFSGEDYTNRIMKMPLTGGDATPVVSGEGSLRGFGIGSDRIYWSSGSLETISSMPLDGTEPPMVLVEDVRGVGAIEIDDQYIFWPEDGEITAKDGRISKTNKLTGETTILASDQDDPDTVALHGGYVYWESGGLYGSGSIWRISVDGGTPEKLAWNLHGPNQIAVDNENVYWTNRGGTLMMMPLGGVGTQ